MSSKRAEAQRAAVATLLSLVPPHRVVHAARAAVRLRGGAKAEEPAFLASVLETINHRLRTVRCAFPRCGRPFLVSEFNRDGDAYRCALCNRFTAADGTCHAAPSDDVARALRRMERRFMELLAEYAALYYGKDALAQCYCWAPTGDPAAEIGVAVLIAHEEPKGDAARRPGAWNATHTFLVRRCPDDTYSYEAHCTIFVDAATPQVRLSGLTHRASRRFSAPATDDDPVVHVPRLGAHLQRTENGLRDELTSIQFGKGAQVTAALRHPKFLGNHTAPAYTPVPAAAAPPPMPPSSVAAPPPMPPAEPSASASAAAELTTPDIWVEAEDESGETCYFNETTGDSAWELPPGAVLETRKQSAHRDPQPVPEPEEGPAVEEEEEWTLPDLFDALELSVPGADLAPDFVAAGVETVEEVANLTAEDLDSLGLGPDDRDAILAWATSQE